jgi:hypothetical protein
MEKGELISQNQNKGSSESNRCKLASTDCLTIQDSPSVTNAFLTVGTEVRAALRENSRKEFCLKQLNMRGLEDKSVEQARQLKRGRYCR